jgi:hypothetical protein
MCDLKNLSGSPLRANRCRELPGVGAFLCVVLDSDSGLTMCKTHPDKTLDPTSERSGFGMRLALISCSSARHPYSALCPPPLTGVARADGRRGSTFAWLLGHARHRGFIPYPGP